MSNLHGLFIRRIIKSNTNFKYPHYLEFESNEGSFESSPCGRFKPEDNLLEAEPGLLLIAGLPPILAEPECKE